MRRKEHGNFFFFFPPSSGAWLETWSPKATKATGCVHKERRKDGTVGGRRTGTEEEAVAASNCSFSRRREPGIVVRPLRSPISRFFHKRSNCFAECMTDKRDERRGKKSEQGPFSPHWVCLPTWLNAT